MFLEKITVIAEGFSLSGFNQTVPINNVNGWCESHNTGCIMQVVGYVIWARTVLLYKGAVTHKGLLCQEDCNASATLWHEKTNVPLKKHSTG